MKNNLASVILIAFIGFLAYFNTLNNDFVWDDNLLIKDNHFIKNFSNITKVFSVDFWEASFKAQKGNFYRPFITASFMVDYLFWKENPFGYHLTNMFFHILNSLIVFMICGYFFSSRASLVGALMFAVNPMRAESVSFISGRTDILSAFFLFASIYIFVISVNSGDLHLSLISAFAFFCSLLCKEASIIGLPIAMLLWFYFKIFSKTKTLFYYIFDLVKKITPFVVTIIIYILIRNSVYSGSIKYSHAYPIDSCFYTMLTMPKIMVLYIIKLLFPVSLSIDYTPEVITGFGSVYFIMPVLLISVILSLAFYCFVKFKEANRLSFIVIYFFISSFPISNIVPMGIFMADRFMYIPSLSLALAFAWVYSYVDKPFLKRASLICFWAVALMLFLLTVRRNYDWSDNYTLWLKTAKVTPESFRAHGSISQMLLKKKLYAEALYEAKLSDFYRPNDSRTIGNIALIYLEMGDYVKAIEYFHKSLNFEPDDFRTHANLYAIYLEQGKLDKALESIRRATECSPYNVDLWIMRGDLSRVVKKYSEAALCYNKVIDISMPNVEKLEEIAAFLKDTLKDYQSASKAYKKLILLNSNNTAAFKNLKECLEKTDRKQ